MHGHSGRCLPGPIPNPEVKPCLRLSHYCGTRVHGKGSHCAPLLSPSGHPQLTSVGAWPVSPWMPAFFAFNRLITHTRQHPKRGHLYADRHSGHLWQRSSRHSPGQWSDVWSSILAEMPIHVLEKIEHALELEMHPISIGGSNLIGALVAGNSREWPLPISQQKSDIDALDRLRRRGGDGRWCQHRW